MEANGHHRPSQPKDSEYVQAVPGSSLYQVSRLELSTVCLTDDNSPQQACHGLLQILVLGQIHKPKIQIFTETIV